MFISKHSCAFAILSTFVGLAAGSMGCSASSSDNANVSGRGEIINQTKSALKSGTITAIGGTYGGACQGHTPDGSDTWSVNMTTPSPADLTVVKDDMACVLTMKSVSVGSTHYLGNPAIAMSDGWATGVSAFQIDGAGDIMFYGNAKLDAVTFAEAFTMSVLVSDDPALTDAGSKAAGFATRSGSATAGTVPASNYTFDLTSGAFALTKNINGIVDTTSGYAQLTAGGSPVNGEDYVIVAGAPATFAEVDAAWNAMPVMGFDHGLLSSLTTLELPSTGFGLEGSDLTAVGGQVRTVIVRHTDPASQVSSYQTFTITFTP